MIMHKYILILIIFILTTKLSCSQHSEYAFLNFDSKNGLADKFIYSFTQDKNKTIWIGTGSGLYYFDGKNFIKLESTEDRAGHQINNLLQNVYFDGQNKIWLSSINAIQYYDIKEKKFHSIDYKKTVNLKVIREYVSSFHRDLYGNLWIGTRKGFWYLYDEKKEVCIPFIPKDSKINNNSKFVSRFIEIEKGKLIALTFNGLYEFDSSGNIKSHFFDGYQNDYSDGYLDKKNNCIWLAAGEDGIGKFDIKTKKTVFYSINDKVKDLSFSNYVNTVSKKNDDEIWFGANLLGVFNVKKNSVKIIPQTYKDEYSFKTTPIARLYKDIENNLWITSFNGLAFLPWQNNQIENIALFNHLGKYTIEPYQTILYKNTDYLITNNTSNGLAWWKSREKKLTIIENPIAKNKPKELNGIVAIGKNSKNEIYCASKNALFLLNQKNNTLNLIKHNGANISNASQILFDEKDNLYIQSSNNGYYFFDVFNNFIKHYNFKDIDPKNDNASTNVMAPKLLDSQNKVWFTLTQGVYCLSKGMFSHLATEKAINTGASIIQSIEIIELYKNNYWITTQDSGIFNLYFKNKKWHLYNYNKENSGLPSNFCNSIIKDKKNNIWIGTMFGLAKFNPKTKLTETILTNQNGLYANSAGQKINLLENNKLVINYYGALSILDLLKYKYNFKKPTLEISEIVVSDSIINIKNNTEKLNLKYNQNYLSFSWKTTGFNNFNQNKTFYKLVNFSKDWILTEKNNVTFLNLQPNNYTLLLKTYNNDGKSSEIISYEFTIQNPFWKTWWFYSILSLLILSIGLGFYYFNLKKIKKEEALKSKFNQELAQIEMKALRAQMNPHFIFNSLNSIQKFILKNDTFAASQYLTKFSKLIRLILDHSNQNYILLSSEIDQLKLYVEIEALRFDNQFDYEFYIDEKLNFESIYIPSMIVQPYIENAIWHGLLHKDDRGKLKIKMSIHKNNCIKIFVEDNGIGREKAQQLKSKQILKKKSYGMDITSNRIDILNKIENKNTICKITDLKDELDHAIGTKVELTIPYKTINYDESYNN